jgi:hypothetical protein
MPCRVDTSELSEGLRRGVWPAYKTYLERTVGNRGKPLGTKQRAVPPKDTLGSYIYLGSLGLSTIGLADFGLEMACFLPSAICSRYRMLRCIDLSARTWQTSAVLTLGFSLRT